MLTGREKGLKEQICRKLERICTKHSGNLSEIMYNGINMHAKMHTEK